MTAPAIHWFRRDLRLADNPALAAAATGGRPVIPVFVLDDGSPGMRAPGGASRWWLHGSLAALDEALRRSGSRLILRRGSVAEVLARLAAETGAGTLTFTRAYGADEAALEVDVANRLRDDGVEVQRFGGALLFEPETVRTKSGTPFKVFTPFWRACCAADAPRPPAPAPERLAPPGRWPTSDALDDWPLRPRAPDWTGGLRETWRPGEAAALVRLDAFAQDGLRKYPAERDRPDRAGTSRLSPHLHFGEVSPRQCWHAVRDRAERAGGGIDAAADAFLRQIGWREFSYHLLHHWPDMAAQPLRREFAAFPWRDDDAGFEAWCRGRTGYPIVDAGMRELWHTGWMHNRVRMIAASFLVKDLLVPWTRGEAWFRDTLVDADPANNAAGWQWVAGCGTDAAPYFRIFNPVTQGRKADPEGGYVRRWVPEIARLPVEHLHAPWTAPPGTLREAGVRLGDAYPEPIVDHAVARQRALDAFSTIRRR